MHALPDLCAPACTPQKEFEQDECGSVRLHCGRFTSRSVMDHHVRSSECSLGRTVLLLEEDTATAAVVLERIAAEALFSATAQNVTD